MIVFSNTTPFIALSSIGQLDLLSRLFGKVRVVDAVADECAQGGPIAVPDLRKTPWVEVVHADPAPAPTVLIDLDLAERLTLHMALRVGADRVLIDEKLGREIAANTPSAPAPFVRSSHRARREKPLFLLPLRENRSGRIRDQ